MNYFVRSSFTLFVVAAASSCFGASDDPTDQPIGNSNIPNAVSANTNVQPSVSSVQSAGANAPPSNTSAQPSSNDEVNGTLIDSVQLGNDYKVDFYDFGNGLLAARETFHRGTSAPLLDQVNASKELAELYRIVKPGAAVPQSIAAADRNAAELRRQNAEQNKTRPPRPAPDQGPPGQSAAPLDGQSAAPLDLNCSGDVYGDNWGADWFLNNYCHPSSAPYKDCQTNWGWHDHNYHLSNYLHYYQFEGDFNEAGAVQVAKWSCIWMLSCLCWQCHWHPLGNDPLPPQNGVHWYFTDSVTDYVRGSGQSPCGHLDYAFLRD